MFRSTMKNSVYSLQKRTAEAFLQHINIYCHRTSYHHSVMKLENRQLCTSINAHSIVNDIIHDSHINNAAATVTDSKLLEKYDKIVTLYKVEDPKHVEKTLSIIKSFNLQSDEEYLYLVVVAYSRTINPKGILNAFSDMKLKGYQKSLFLLNELMFVYSKLNDIVEVENTLMTVKIMGIQPDTTTIYHLLSTILNSSGPLDWDYFIDTYITYFSPYSNELKAGGIKLITDDSIYRLLLRGCYKHKNIKEAIYWFNEYLATSIQPNRNIIRTFYETLGKKYLCKFKQPT